MYIFLCASFSSQVHFVFSAIFTSLPVHHRFSEIFLPRLSPFQSKLMIHLSFSVLYFVWSWLNYTAQPRHRHRTNIHASTHLEQEFEGGLWNCLVVTLLRGDSNLTRNTGGASSAGATGLGRVVIMMAKETNIVTLIQKTRSRISFNHFQGTRIIPDSFTLFSLEATLGY